jgi:uncharacterized surface protein with fasciclin (FAS1) repeats
MNESNNTGAWIAGVLVVLVLLGLGYWYFYGRTEAPATEVEQQATTTPQANNTNTQNAVAREDRVSSDVASVVASIPEASRFAALFSSTGVSASVGASGTYTIFVPTDGAFNLLVPGTLDGLTAAERKRIIQYHVVSGKKLDIDAINTGNIMSLSKDALNFQVSDAGTSVQVNSSFAIKAYQAKNGIVYLINGVLLPPEAPIN